MNRFERAIKVLAVHEGGFSDHPKDPGGRTMKGVTQRTYDWFNRRNGTEIKDVRSITDAEVFEIYKRQYWDKVSGDSLPSGVAYCVFDGAVNSGPSQSTKWAQRIVGAGVDGVMGDETIGLIAGYDPIRFIDEYCDMRFAFMKTLKHWGSFKNGWTRRVSEVRQQSKDWVKGNDVARSIVADQPKANGLESVKSVAKDAAMNPGVIAAVGGAVGSVGTMASGDGPVQYALAAVLVVVTLVAVWKIFGRKK